MTYYRLIWELPMTPHAAAVVVPDEEVVDAEPVSTKTTNSHWPRILILRLFLAASNSPWIIAIEPIASFYVFHKDACHRFDEMRHLVGLATLSCKL